MLQLLENHASIVTNAKYDRTNLISHDLQIPEVTITQIDRNCVLPLDLTPPGILHYAEVLIRTVLICTNNTIHYSFCRSSVAVPIRTECKMPYGTILLV